MVDSSNQQNPLGPILSDISTQIRDIDERNRLVRERVLLLGKNLITSRKELEEKLESIRKENSQIKSSIEKLERSTKNLSREIDRFVKREEMAIVERMLKDFQPLEFMRKKDIETLIEEKINTLQKEINTKEIKS